MKQDEYNWNEYHKLYAVTRAKVTDKFTTLLTKDNHSFDDRVVNIKEGFKPLHEYHRLLYETILELDPFNIHEVGCGYGDDLANISTLSEKKIIVRGSDISSEQLKILGERHPWLKGYINHSDITKNAVSNSDIVYTKAVLMHQSDVNLEKAILNIASSAQKHIVMIENLRRDYEVIFKKINPPKWKDANIRMVLRHNAHIIIISK